MSVEQIAAELAQELPQGRVTWYVRRNTKVRLSGDGFIIRDNTNRSKARFEFGEDGPPTMEEGEEFSMSWPPTGWTTTP
jgi:hypothetical protein